MLGGTMQQEQQVFKYFTKHNLIQQSKIAANQKLNRQLNVEALEELSDEYRYPVTFAMLHNDTEMRVKIVFGPAPDQEGWLDISIDAYEQLPITEPFTTPKEVN
jgi:NAD(P)H-flavin reductase